MRRRILLLAALAGLALPGAAAADFDSGFYSHRKNDCASRSDPITIVFYGYATGTRTLNHVKKHTGWGGGDGGGQFFATHGNCVQGGQHAENGIFTRYHIRMRKTWHDDATWGTTTTSTPHHEDWIDSPWTGCWPGNHAVDKGGIDKGEGLQSGFDQGRSKIFDKFYGTSGHAFGGAVYWGNTQEFKQCDGDWAGSHGTVYWFRIPNSSH